MTKELPVETDAIEYRNQIIQELIDRIGPKASVYSYSRYGCMELEWDYSVAEWLRSQMGESDEQAAT